MKYFILIFVVALSLFTTFGVAQAVNFCDETSGGRGGLVPCGRFCKNDAGQPVECGTMACTSGGVSVACQQLYCRCELVHVFLLASKVFNFILLVLAMPLAGLLIVIGGLLLLLSGINQSWYDTGKKMIMGAIIAVVLILCSWLLVNIVMTALGFQGQWWNPFL